MKKVFVAVPCMDQVSTCFCASYAMLEKKDCEIVQSFLRGSLIYDSRNQLVKQALSYGADYVLWLDSDMEFPKDTITKLMAHMEKYDIVSGLYFRRQPPFSPVIFKTLNENGEHEGFDDYPQELFEVEGIGFGCVMVKMELLVEMALNKHTWFTPMANLGEDLAFCLRARELGHKIMVDPSIKCGHEGKLMVTEQTFLTMKG